MNLFLEKYIHHQYKRYQYFVFEYYQITPAKLNSPIYHVTLMLKRITQAVVSLSQYFCQASYIMFEYDEQIIYVWRKQSNKSFLQNINVLKLDLQYTTIHNAAVRKFKAFLFVADYPTLTTVISDSMTHLMKTNAAEKIKTDGVFYFQQKNVCYIKLLRETSARQCGHFSTDITTATLQRGIFLNQ